MSIYKRLSQINCNLLKKNIPKTGYNKHTKSKYYELADMIPHATVECYQANIALVFPFCESVAILKLVDMDDHSKYITYRLRIPELVVPEKNPNNKIIQDYGADITYLKRYLLQLAFPCFSDKDFIDDEVASSAETKNTKSKTSVSNSKSSKKEDEVKEVPIGKLTLEARDKLVKGGIDENEITPQILKQKILHLQKWTVPERRYIINYFKEQKENDLGGS